MTTDFPDPPELPGNKKPPGVLLDLGAKLAGKWAEQYVDIYIKRGSEAAKQWAAVFLPNEEHRKLLRDAALKLMEKKGVYRVPTPPQSA